MQWTCQERRSRARRRLFRKFCFRNLKSLTRGSPGTAGRLLESWIGYVKEIFESACPKSRALHRKRGTCEMSRALMIPPEC